MRVVHYLPHLLSHESGPGAVIFGQSRALLKMDVDVRWVVSADKPRLAVPDGIELVQVGHRLSKQLMVPVDFEAALENADVLVLHGGWTMWNIAAGRIARKLNVPFVVCAHGVYHPRLVANRALLKRVWLTLLERRHLNSALGIQIFFKDETDHLRRIGVRTPLLIVPNGYDWPKSTTWDGGSGGYVLWVGRFDYVTKGLDQLVRAVAHMSPDERPTVRLHGTDWEGGKRAIQDLVDEHDLGRWVTLEAPIYGPAKKEALVQARAFVYPSRWDACPTSPIEAVAVGVPTLVTDYPLGKMLAAEGAAIMSGRSPHELADGIRSVLAEPAKKVARRGAALVAIMLSWEAVAFSWLKELQSLLEQI